MIPPGVRGNKRDWYHVRKTEMKFRELLAEFKSNKEIMDELGLKRRTFFRYKSIIRQEDRIIWRKIMEEREFR
jgi:DNA invertase Pin-like site-specific DNA recombinase